jgi:hypothetical protein
LDLNRCLPKENEDHSKLGNAKLSGKEIPKEIRLARILVSLDMKVAIVTG